VQVTTMLIAICGRFKLELAPEMGGEAGVLEKQISSFTLAVDGGLFMLFHGRSNVSHHGRAACLRLWVDCRVLRCKEDELGLPFT
jgi:hypothetical protein